MTHRPAGCAYQPPFEECTGCRHFDRRRPAPICKRCGIGEHFEERLEELFPDRDTFLRSSRRNRDHDDDE